MLCMYMAAWAQLRRRQPGAVEFSLLTWAAAIYTLGYAVEITRTRLADVMWALRIEYLGLAFLPALLLIFTLRMVRDRPLQRRWTAALLAISLVTLIMVWTADQHSWYYVSPRIESGVYFPVFVAEHGAWYNLQLSYVILSGIVCPLLLFRCARRAEGRRRWQASLLGLGALFPIVAAALNAAGISLYGIDLGPFGIALSVLVFGVALFRFGLFEIVPAARELALDAVREAFVVVDQAGRILDLNRATRFLPGAAQWRIGQQLPRSGELGEAIYRSLEHPAVQMEFSAEDEDGSTRFFRAHAYPLKDAFSRLAGNAVLISDISETARLIRRLDAQASTDELTGLLNRRAVMQAGQQLLRRQGEMRGGIGILMMDLDNLKTINDTFGHQTGDKVLHWLGHWLLNALREEDVIGRYGGDEFVVLLPDADTATALQVAERLCTQIAASQPLQEEPAVRVSVSLGVYATVADGSLSMDGLLRAADQALYRAKYSGKNRVSL